MLDKRFSIDESPDIVVNLTFKTTVLADGGGGEERNINWQSPLLNFDLQKVILHKPQLDEIIQFFEQTRVAGFSFRYRDWSDYLVTAQPRDTRYGSSTQGLLFPTADGVRTEFDLVKRYIVPSCIHYRAIATLDPYTATVYDAGFNPLDNTDWVFADGKFIFTTPPIAGQLFCEGEFDVPVVFGSEEYQYQIKSTKDSNTYGIEGLQLNEVRENVQHLKDKLGEIDAPFALSGHFNSLVGMREQTEIITLASGFDRRTSRFPKPKGTYFMGKIPLRDDELEYLIALFRCVKGKGISWAFGDVSYQKKNVAVRFDEDNLSLRLNRKGRYEVDGLKAIEVFEPLPASLIDSFAVSSQQYLQFFAPTKSTDPSSPSAGGYPAAPFYLLDLPYLSVFINSDTPKRLVSTYNGVQKIIGEIPYFDSLGAVNLNYKGNGKFYGTALSTDKTKFIIFTDSGIGSVKNLDPTRRNFYLSGNVAWDNNNKQPFVYLLPQTAFTAPITSLTFNFNSPELTYTWTNPIGTKSEGFNKFYFTFGDSFSFSYADNREIKNGSILGEPVMGQSSVNINYALDNGNRKLYSSNEPGQSNAFYTADLGYTTNETVIRDWQWQDSQYLEASDIPSRQATFKAQGTYSLNNSLNFINTTNIQSKPGYLQDISLFGSVTQKKLITSNLSRNYFTPQVISDHKTVNNINNYSFLEVTKSSLNGNYNVGYQDWYISGAFEFLLDSDTSTIERTINSSLLNIDFKFNLGDLGIYLENKFQQTTQFDRNEDRKAKYKGVVYVATVNKTGGGQIAQFAEQDRDGQQQAFYSQTESFIQPENSQVYKIAYLSNERTAKAGYAKNCILDNTIIHNFYLDNNSVKAIVITLNTAYTRQTDFISNGTLTNSLLASQTYATQSIFSSRKPLDSKDVRNFNFQATEIIVKAQYSGNIYLALCKVNSLTPSQGQSNYGSNTFSTNSVYVTQLNCEIISVQKIKSFFTASNFFFTVNGCEVFKFLDPYRTNLIRDKGKVYLAVTMPPVTKDNTQTLVWQLVSDGLEFYGVFGGRVDSIAVSPGADKWVKYY